jgi:hypothetical protein
MNQLLYTPTAEQERKDLEADKSLDKRWKAVRKALGMMEVNLKHPGLHTHKYDSLIGDNGEDVFEAYAENNTPAAYRIFWHYGPGKGEITIVAITPHP